MLLAHSYRYDPSGKFELASGKQSHHYVDCKATTMRGEAAELVGQVFASSLPASVEAVGGLTMGADPIAGAIASYCTRHGRPLDWFAVRKEPKKHGLRNWIEGAARKGTRVAVVDDVVTTGGSTIDAIRKCREEGLIVDAILVLVDRQEDDGLGNIRRAAGEVPVVAIFTLAELSAEHARQHPAGPRSATG